VEPQLEEDKNGHMPTFVGSTRGLLGQQSPALLGDTTTQMWEEGQVGADSEHATTLAVSACVRGVPRGQGLTKRDSERHVGLRGPFSLSLIILHWEPAGQLK
jgi:hypothetical protein